VCTSDRALGRAVELVLDEAKHDATLAHSGLAQEHQLGLEHLLSAAHGVEVRGWKVVLMDGWMDGRGTTHERRGLCVCVGGL